MVRVLKAIGRLLSQHVEALPLESLLHGGMTAPSSNELFYAELLQHEAQPRQAQERRHWGPQG